LQELVESSCGLSLRPKAPVGAVPGEPDGAVGDVIGREDGAVDCHNVGHHRRHSSSILNQNHRLGT
jgi:hypothetical protein